VKIIGTTCEKTKDNNGPYTRVETDAKDYDTGLQTLKGQIPNGHILISVLTKR
jgi:hypothetical protein